MSAILGVLVLISFIDGLILSVIMLESGYDKNWLQQIGSWAFVNPFVVYKFNTSVNWFGAFVIAFLLSLACPIGAMLYWIYKLGWLFCKLCTIGRK
jgi:hypothetical protein